MTEQTAFAESQQRERDRAIKRQSVDMIMGVLRDYIPHHSFRAARDELEVAFLKAGVELTNGEQRRIYEEMAKLSIMPLNARMEPS